MKVGDTLVINHHTREGIQKHTGTIIFLQVRNELRWGAICLLKDPERTMNFYEFADGEFALGRRY